MSEQTSDHLEGIEGVVKWFDPRKGFGFIVGPAEQDIFVHYSVIEGDGFRALKDGSKVVYDADKIQDRWKATRVVSTEPSEPSESSDSIEVTVMPRRGFSQFPRRSGPTTS